MAGAKAEEPPKARYFLLDGPAVLERGGKRVVLPVGTELILPDGLRPEPWSPRTVWPAEGDMPEVDW